MDAIFANFDERDEGTESDSFNRYTQITSHVLRRNELMQEYSANVSFVTYCLKIQSIYKFKTNGKK